MIKKDAPTEEYRDFAERLVVTCCALGRYKKRLCDHLGIRPQTMTTYENASRFFQGKDIAAPDGALRKLCKELGVNLLWLIEGERSILSGYIRDKIDEFEALSKEEQLKRANELGWWQVHGRPRKQPASRPSKK